MLKKTITYTDYNGIERKEDFYFNLSKAELMEMEMSVDGGMASLIKKIVTTFNQPGLIKLFKDLILMAYGEKSDDGKRFIKSQELRDAFSQTEAYSNLFMELASDSKAASEFVNAIIPSDMVKELEKSGMQNKVAKELGVEQLILDEKK